MKTNETNIFTMPDGMSEENKALLEPVLKRFNDVMQEFKDTIIDEAVIENMVSKAMEGRDTDIEMIKTALKSQRAAISAKSAVAQPEVSKSLRDVVDEMIEDSSYIESATSKSTYRQVLKAAAPMTVNDNRAAVTLLTGLTVQEPYVSPRRRVSALERLLKGTVDTDSISWVNEGVNEGDVAFTAEGTKAPEISWKYTTESTVAKAVSGFTKITRQAMRNAGFMTSSINRLLTTFLYEKLDSAIISGTGTGEQIKGFINYAVPFTMTELNGEFNSPNICDAIYAMGVQMENGYFTPTAVYLNPLDAARVRAIKNKVADYISSDALAMLDNMEIVTNPTITKGIAYVVDETVINTYLSGATVLSTENDGNDHTENKKTTVVFTQIIQYVSDNQKNGIVKGTLADIIAQLAAPEEAPETPEVP